MRPSDAARRGLTLVELVVTLAIIGVLAAAAVPMAWDIFLLVSSLTPARARSLSAGISKSMLARAKSPSRRANTTPICRWDGKSGRSAATRAIASAYRSAIPKSP